MARPDRRSIGNVVFLLLALTGVVVFGSSRTVAQNSVSVSNVKRVVSADTLVLTNGKVIRLIGIVAPEAPEAAEQSRKIVEDMLLEKNIEVWIDGQNAPQRHLDQYGRLLCYVYLLPSRKMANAEIVRQGAAFLYGGHYLDMAAKNNLLSAEYQARRGKLGVWAQATESPDEIAKRQGKTYNEPPFTLPPDPAVAEKKPDTANPPTTPVTRDTPAETTRTVPPLDGRQGYTGVRVEGCGLLEVAPLGRLSLIGVQNVPGKAGESARVEVARLVQGKKLRFSYDEINENRGHRDKEGNLLVYAMLPDGSLLNLQIVTRGIADVDIDYDFQFKLPMVTARDNARAKQTGPRWGASGSYIVQTAEVILQLIQVRYPKARLTSDRTLLIQIDDPDFLSEAGKAEIFVHNFDRSLLLNGVEKIILQSSHTGRKIYLSTGKN